MIIDSIDIRHAMGARRVQLDLPRPVTLFAGKNGAGKSSTAEAVRLALGDDPVRVALKKDYSALVTEGQKKGRVTVVATESRALEPLEYTITLPDGKRGQYAIDHPAMPFLLDPSRLAALSADDRRNFLFAMMGCSVSTAKVRDLLIKRGCDKGLIEEALPLIQSGFPAACDFAKGRARDEKAAWKAVTGETYGEKKADDWRAHVPFFDARRLDAVGIELDAIQGRIEAAAQHFGSLCEKAQAHARWSAAAVARQNDAARLPDLRSKLEFDEGELAKWETEVQRLQDVAGTGPRDGLIHDLARALYNFVATFGELNPEEPEDIAATEALKAYEAQYGALDAQGDPDAAAKLLKAIEARDLMARAVENTRRDIARIEALAQAEQEPEHISDEALAQAEQGLDSLRASRQDLDAERQRLDAAAHAAKAAAQTTEKAAAHHQAVSAWLQIADALAPEGVPSELLAQALTPINDRLRQSAAATGWMQVAIGADISITAAGRPYPLLSASEQWRTDTMLAEAIAHLSGLRLLILDAMEILEIPARGTLLMWLDGLAAAQELDTALVFATLKSAPTGLPESIAAHWIENGVVETLETAAA